MSQEPKIDWRPSAPLNNLKERANLYKLIRNFFEEREVLEVETPLMGKSNSLDINIQPFMLQSTQGDTRVMQTSPEFFMKRLLCSGSGSIFQICKAFRDEEHGALHNPEFSMLEWYRVGFDLQALILEVDTLIQEILHTSACKQLSYESLFERYHLNPHQDSFDDCEKIALKYGAPSGLEKDGYLDYLFSLALEQLDQHQVWVIDGFPASQAALSQIDRSGPYPVAQRFEFYYQGHELANGYLELSCAKEQSERFEHELGLRKSLKKTTFPIDEKLLQALEAGLPACAGVALGLDRLLMLKLGEHNIEKVVSFGFDAL